MSTDPLLQTPPSTIDPSELDDALDVSPPSARSIRATKVLAALLLVAVGATGATWWAHRSGTTSGRAGFGADGQLPAGFASRFPGANDAGPTASPSATSTGGTASAATTTGTVKLVDGANVYVETSDGTVVKVRTTASTKVTRESAGTVSGLTAGQTVTVTGSTGSDGVVAATAITGKATK